MKTVGVLALQGDFEAHRKAVEAAASPEHPARAVEVRTAAELEACDALILPGGESTTMLTLLAAENLMEPLREFGARKPIFGTCAGAILLATAVSHPAQPSLQLIDIDVERNAYGRQIQSRVTTLETEDGPLEAVFIRAPIIRRVGPETHVLARYLGDPVWVEQGRHMVTTFHPELSRSHAIHRRFLRRI